MNKQVFGNVQVSDAIDRLQTVLKQPVVLESLEYYARPQSVYAKHGVTIHTLEVVKPLWSKKCVLYRDGNYIGHDNFDFFWEW